MFRLARTTRTLAAAAMATALALLACSREPTSADDGLLEARLTSGGIRLTNHASAPVYTFVIGAHAAAVSNWAPCTNASICPPIPPAGATVVPPPRFGGEREGRALVYWWFARRGSDGSLHPDRIRVVSVDLPA